MSIMIAWRTGRIRDASGKVRMVKKGLTTADASADIVRTHPHLWQPLKVDYAAPFADPLEAQVRRLAEFIADEFPQYVDDEFGPIDMAIRLIDEQILAHRGAERVPDADPAGAGNAAAVASPDAAHATLDADGSADLDPTAEPKPARKPRAAKSTPKPTTED